MTTLTTLDVACRQMKTTTYFTNKTQKTVKSIARELIPCTTFDPAIVKPN